MHLYLYMYMNVCIYVTFLDIKGLVLPKMKMWCLSVYPQGIQDVGDFVSSVEHKKRFLTQTIAVCQSYNSSHGFESQKKHTQSKQNRTLRLVTIHWGVKTQNDRSVQETVQYLYIYFFTPGPPQCPTVRSAFTTAGTSMYHHEPQGLIWFVCLCLLFFSLNEKNLWVPLTAIIWLADCNGFKLKIFVCVLLKK